MTMGMLVPVALLVLLAVGLLLLVGRGRDSLDLSPRNLVRGYLYLASLLGIGLLTFGLAGIGNWAIASAFGPSTAYGRYQHMSAMPPRCPPGMVDPMRCPSPEALELQRERERESRERGQARQALEDLIRGVTFGGFGLLVWVVHWWGRRRVAAADEGASVLHRAYLVGGVTVFGLATLLGLPVGVYQLLVALVLPTQDARFIPGVAEALTFGLAALPVWLLFLRALLTDVSGPRPPVAATA